MPPLLRLNIQPDERAALMATLRAMGDQARRTLSDPRAGEQERAEAIAIDLRSRILQRAAREPDLITKKIAARLQCSVHVVRRTISGYNNNGLSSLTPGRAGRKRDEFVEKQSVLELKTLLEHEPDAGPEELALRLGLSRSRFFHYAKLANVRFRPRGRPKSC